jgi:hypothetical protein
LAVGFGLHSIWEFFFWHASGTVASRALVKIAFVWTLFVVDHLMPLVWAKL